MVFGRLFWAASEDFFSFGRRSPLTFSDQLVSLCVGSISVYKQATAKVADEMEKERRATEFAAEAQQAREAQAAWNKE